MEGAQRVEIAVQGDGAVQVEDARPMRAPGDRDVDGDQLSVAPLLASAVQSIHEETSVSRLFL